MTGVAMTNEIVLKFAIFSFPQFQTSNQHTLSESLIEFKDHFPQNIKPMNDSPRADEGELILIQVFAGFAEALMANEEPRWLIESSQT